VTIPVVLPCSVCARQQVETSGLGVSVRRRSPRYGVNFPRRATDGADVAVRVKGPLRSNNGELLCHAAVDGLGLMRASELEVMRELRAAKLVQVLDDFQITTNVAVWALYPSAKHVLPRMRVLLDFLATWFREAHNQAQLAAGPFAVMADSGTIDRAKMQLRVG